MATYKTMKRHTERISTAVVFIVLLFILFPPHVSRADDPPLKIGVLAKRGILRCMEEWSPTAEYLTNKVPDKTFEIVALDFDKVCSAVENGNVDFVLSNPSFYIELEIRYGANRIATLKNLRLGGAHTSYGGVVFCKANRTDIKHMTDLNGKTFMGVKETCFGGWRMAWREFKEKNIDPYSDFRALTFGGTHDAVVYAVRDGKVDAGTVRTDTLERMEMDGNINLKDFHVIHEHGGGAVHLPFLHSTRLYPEWPFAKIKHTPDELAEKVTTALLEMPRDSAAAKAARCAGWTIPLNYQSVHECLKELKAGPYKGFGNISPFDALRQYWKLIIFSALVFVAMAGSGFFILKLNRGINKSHVKLQKEMEERKQAEETLIKSAARYKSLFETVPVGLYRTTMEGEIIDANPAMIQLLGYPDLKALKKINTKDIVHPEDRNRIHARLEQDGVVYDFEMRVHKCDGTIIHVRDRVKAVRDGNGRILYQEGSLEDITERNLAEEALKESESRYRTLVESSTDAILMMDKERNITHCNKACLSLFGYRRGQIEGRSIRIIHPSDQSFDSFGHTAYPMIERHGYFRTEWDFLRKDGTIIPVETVTSPIGLSDGTVEGYIAMIRDISERIQAGEEHVRLSTAIEQAAESVVITDRDGTIQYVNPAFKVITGYSRKEVIGKNSRILKSGKHGKEFYTSMWKTITNGRVWKGHFINTKKDGTLYQIEATISPIKNGTGEIINFVAVNRDVTEEIKLEGKLRQAQKMEAIGTLAGGIAHDFNNILSAIMGYTELAEYDMPEGSKARNNLMEVLKAGRRAKDLVQQILAFSRQGEQERKPLKISHIINEALKLLRASLPTTIDIRRSTETDTDIIEADSTQIHQIMINLCANAAHAMNNNGGVLKVGIRNVKVGNKDRGAEYPNLPPGPYVMLTVRDTGHGMSAEVLDHIFDPYFSTKEKGEGTGLGLAVVHGIVKSHGGAITAYSEVGKGSTFNIYFPATEKKVVQKEEKAEVISTGHQRILFVDDEPALVDIGKKMLEHLGYEVVARVSSVEALEAFRNNPDKFDLIITDKTMPQMTGFDLAGEIKQIRPDIPIILCTGFSDTTDTDKAKAMGISGLIMKPVVGREMAESIKHVLEG